MCKKCGKEVPRFTIVCNECHAKFLQQDELAHKALAQERLDEENAKAYFTEIKRLQEVMRENIESLLRQGYREGDCWHP